MARDFDGTNDNIDFGSDASVDDFVVITICAWVRADAAAADDVLLIKSNTGGDAGATLYIGNTRMRFIRPWSTANADWNSGAASLPTGELHHVAVTYDRGDVANDPTFYVDGVAQTTTEVTAPTGTVLSDAAESLQAGETNSGANDLDGLIGHLVYHDAILTAAEINRARWWGRPRGGMKVYHPLWSAKLANEGSAVATGTATGTTVDNASCPRVERMWGSMMGVGR